MGDRPPTRPAPRIPLIYAHRGLPTRHPENTLPSLRAALAAGANALEIDLSLTADGQLVLWHDPEPTVFDPVALIRNLGLEPEMRYRPTYPSLGSPQRRPVHEHDLESFRRAFGYRETATGSPAAVTIPTLEEFVAFARRHPGLERICLDVKLPPGRPDLHAEFARAIDRAFAGSGLEGKVVIDHYDPEALGRLQARLGDRYRFMADATMAGVAIKDDPGHPDYDLPELARKARAALVSIGRFRLESPLSWLLGSRRESYLEIVRRNRERIDASGQPTELVAWTINDPEEMRALIEIGVDGIITDKPALLRRVIAEMSAKPARRD